MTSNFSNQFHVIAHSANTHGWVPDSIVTALTRNIFTVAGVRQATLHITETEGTIVFTGYYDSEGRNVLSTLNLSVPADAHLARIATVTLEAIDEAMQLIKTSYGVYLLDYQNTPNSNCLIEFRCSACGAYGPFKIDTDLSRTVTVHDDGTDESDGPVEWEACSPCSCTECGFSAQVRDFTEGGIPKFSEIQLKIIEAYEDGDNEVTTLASVQNCGDGLLKFLLQECSDVEGCESIEDAYRRVDTAMFQLMSVRDSLNT